MTMGTRKANADAHPGRIIINSQQKRRTRKQIEEDEEYARAEASAIQEDAVAKRCAVIAHLAELENSAQEEENTKKRYSSRPDLRRNSMQAGRIILRLPSRKAANLAPLPDDMVVEGGDDDEDSSESDFNVPPTSTVLNESSPPGSLGLIVPELDDDEDPPQTLDHGSDEDCCDEMLTEPPDVVKRGRRKKAEVGRHVLSLT
jgi:hypothetical protein